MNKELRYRVSSSQSSPLISTKSDSIKNIPSMLRNIPLGYAPLSTDDDYDNIPTLFVYSTIDKQNNNERSTFYPKVLLTFSLSGIIFLSSITYLLATESPYLRVGEKYHYRKKELSEKVLGAALIYFVLFIISLYFLYVISYKKLNHPKQYD